MNLPPCYPDSYQNDYISSTLAEIGLDSEKVLNFLYENELKIGWIPEDNEGYS